MNLRESETFIRHAHYPPETYLPQQRKMHQALEHGLILVTVDKQISQYPVQVLNKI